MFALILSTVNIFTLLSLISDNDANPMLFGFVDTVWINEPVELCINASGLMLSLFNNLFFMVFLVPDPSSRLTRVIFSSFPPKSFHEVFLPVNISFKSSLERSFIGFEGFTIITMASFAIAVVVNSKKK